jgi:hypothetical protein
VRIALRIAPAVVLLLCLGACDGGGKKSAAGTFDVGSPKGAAAPSPGATVAAGKLKPPAPARMFAGTSSVVGQLTRYCKSTCIVSDPASPTYLKVPSGAFVLFTLGEIPQAAVAEVRVRSNEKPGTVTLNPSTTMVFNYGLGEGKYLVDLYVRWKASEARWRFGLTVT